MHKVQPTSELDHPLLHSAPETQASYKVAREHNEEEVVSMKTLNYKSDDFGRLDKLTEIGKSHP